MEMIADDVMPRCQTADGCYIPPLMPTARWATELRIKLIEAKELGISGDRILKLQRASALDIELALMADRAYRKIYNEGGQ